MPSTTKFPFNGTTIVIHDELHTCRLYPIGNRQWGCKKRGRSHYFGSLKANPKDVLDEWMKRWPSIVTGRPLPAVHYGNALTIETLRQSYCAHVGRRLKDGGLSHHTVRDIAGCIDLFMQHVPSVLVSELMPMHFDQAMTPAKHWGTFRRAKYVTTIRTMFNWAHRSGIATNVPQYGEVFRCPSKTAVRSATSLMLGQVASNDLDDIYDHYRFVPELMSVSINLREYWQLPPLGFPNEVQAPLFRDDTVTSIRPASQRNHSAYDKRHPCSAVSQYPGPSVDALQYHSSPSDW